MTTPKQGHFVLHSNVMPPMTAGAYQLVTDQGGLPFTVAEEVTHVTVSSPRFTMAPDQILSTFPPANGEGSFGDRLPQIVLKRRTLPWERNPTGSPVVSTTPWLALVVVAENEASLSTATPVAQCVTAGVALLDPQDKDVEQGLYLSVTETVVRKLFPCEQDLALLTHVREVDVTDTELANGDDDGWLAVVLANRLPVYDAVNDAAVRYMACLVNVEGQLPELPPPTPPVDDFHFELAQDWSVLAEVQLGPDPRVMGGVDLGDIALPHIAMMDAAPATQAFRAAPRAATGAGAGAAIDGAIVMEQHPVGDQWSRTTEKVAAAAMDPDASYMVRDTMASGFRLPIEIFALERVLRFPVLAHWSFTTTGDLSFEYLMQHLDVGLLGTVPVPAADAPPPTHPRPEVVQTGHIGLGHRTRRGDTVRAWYRGPFVPFPTTRDQPVNGVLQLAHSADQIRRVVPDGREDLSLASAFEIGRLLGLSQLSVVSALLRFRNEQFGAGRVHSLLDSITTFEIPGIFDEFVDLGRFISLQVVDDLWANPQDRIGPRRPVADPGRPVELSAALDAVIATGLGFDLDAVRKVGDAIGLAAALATTRAPVAAPTGRLEFDESVRGGLRAALVAEVNHVVGIAAVGPERRQPAGRPRAQAAAPARDALDDLIDHAVAHADRDPEEP